VTGIETKAFAKVCATLKPNQQARPEWHSSRWPEYSMRRPAAVEEEEGTKGALMFFRLLLAGILAPPWLPPSAAGRAEERAVGPSCR